MSQTGHRWYKLASIPWPVCKGCGLIALRNPITDWCIRQGCDYDDHPQYVEKLKTLTKSH